MPELPTCRLRARAVYEWDYEADLADDPAYRGLTAQQAAASDEAFMSQHPSRHVEGTPSLTVEVVGATSPDGGDVHPSVESAIVDAIYEAIREHGHPQAVDTVGDAVRAIADAVHAHGFWAPTNDSPEVQR